MSSRRAVLLLVLAIAVAGASSAPGNPPLVGQSIHVVRADPRACPSPLCGGYWVARANHARTRCHDGLLRPRCYAADAVDVNGQPLASGIPDGALALADLESVTYPGLGELGRLVETAVYAPAGRAPESGSFYRLVDTGVRCVRAPCFSIRASRLNRSSRTLVSGIAIGAPRATPEERASAEAALGTKAGLLARGLTVPARDGGRIFRSTRFYLRSKS